MDQHTFNSLNSKRFIRIWLQLHLIHTMRFEPEIIYRVLQRATTHSSFVEGEVTRHSANQRKGHIQMP